MASHFIEKADFNTIIPASNLDFITGNDDDILLEMADEAVEEMKSYLAERYAVSEIFAASGGDRNKTLLMYGKDIALYHLFSRRHQYRIPEIRAKRYDAAVKWLKNVQQQIINPTLLQSSGIKTIIGGGNIKRENHQE
ncbi:MAG: DUF1320 family protein [Bacteroidetes bacterium]|nr:DUF1320 family protein [Bacteroidota bacterium]